MTVEVDPRARARQLGQVRDAVLTGGRPPQSPRALIGESWRRVRCTGLDPARPPEVPLLGTAELERSREASGLRQLLPLLRARLLPVAQDAGQLLVVVDRSGRVLWLEGGLDVRRRADTLGFLAGSAWDESSVGTNAIGTSLVVGRPVDVHAAEHYADSHQPWTCAAAPLHDPVTGALLGAVDLSGPASTVHAGTLALVDAVARLAVLELRSAYEQRLHQLRALGAPLLAEIGGRALVVSVDGLVAAACGLAAPHRVTLPELVPGGTAWLPSLGTCVAEALPGGWLLRLQDDGSVGEQCHLLLELDAVPRVRVTGPSGQWQHSLTVRHAELLLALAEHPDGRTAAQLAGDLFGEAGRTVTVRAELSRLRRALGPLLDSQPYRIAESVQVEVRLPADRRRLLPTSVAPLVLVLRAATAASTDGQR